MSKLHMSLFLALALSGAMAQTAAKKPVAPKPATAATSSSHQPSEQEVSEFLHHTFGYDQNVKYRVLDIHPASDPALTEVTVMLNTTQGQQMMKLYVTPGGKYALSGDFVPFGPDPFAPTRAILKEKMNGPARGPATAPVTIVEFGDLQCPACKRAQPTIEKLLGEVPNAKLVFQQFPLVSLHKWAMTAAKYGLCVARQDNAAYWKFVDTVYSHQDEMQSMSEEQVTPLLKQYAGESGADAAKVETCTADPSVAVQINSSMELGRELEVTGTPTLFVGGRKIGNVGGIPYETLKAITEFQAESK